jgi:hypothetical protein
MVCVWSHQQQRLLVSGRITGSAPGRRREQQHSSRAAAGRKDGTALCAWEQATPEEQSSAARPQARSRHRRRIRPQRRVRRPAASRVAALPALKPSLTQLEFPGSLGRCDTETHVFLSTYCIAQIAYNKKLSLSLALALSPGLRGWPSGPDPSPLRFDASELRGGRGPESASGSFTAIQVQVLPGVGGLVQ